MLHAQQLCSQLARNWKQTKWTSKGEWIHKLCYTHAIEYYLAIRRNEFRPDIMLSYRSWTQKSTHLYLFACNSKAGKTNLRIKKKNQQSSCHWVGRLPGNGHKGTFWGDGSVLYRDKVYPLVKIVQLRSVYFNVCKSYLKKNCKQCMGCLWSEQVKTQMKQGCININC